MITLVALLAVGSAMLMPLALDKTYKGGPLPRHSPIVKIGKLGDNKVYILLKSGDFYTYEGHKRWKWKFSCKDKNTKYANDDDGS